MCTNFATIQKRVEIYIHSLVSHCLRRLTFSASMTRKAATLVFLIAILSYCIKFQYDYYWRCCHYSVCLSYFNRTRQGKTIKKVRQSYIRLYNSVLFADASSYRILLRNPKKLYRKEIFFVLRKLDHSPYRYQQKCAKRNVIR